MVPHVTATSQLIKFLGDASVYVTNGHQVPNISKELDLSSPEPIPACDFG